LKTEVHCGKHERSYLKSWLIVENKIAQINHPTIKRFKRASLAKGFGNVIDMLKIVARARVQHNHCLSKCYLQFKRKARGVLYPIGSKMKVLKNPLSHTIQWGEPRRGDGRHKIFLLPCTNLQHQQLPFHKGISPLPISIGPLWQFPILVHMLAVQEEACFQVEVTKLVKL
jgi:hypothetical protein